MDGQLVLGIRILEVNGQSLLGATHQEAVRSLRNVGNKLTLMVCDGFDSKLIENNSPAHKPLSEKSQSVSSIDREEEDSLIIRKVDRAQYSHIKVLRVIKSHL